MSKRRGKRIVVGYVVSHTGKRGGPWEANRAVVCGVGTHDIAFAKRWSENGRSDAEEAAAFVRRCSNPKPHARALPIVRYEVDAEEESARAERDALAAELAAIRAATGEDPTDEVLHAASMAVPQWTSYRARVAELEAERDDALAARISSAVNALLVGTPSDATPAPQGQPVATDEELDALYTRTRDMAMQDRDLTRLDAIRRGVAAVARHVRAERPACLVARAVALGCDIQAVRDVRGNVWVVRMFENGSAKGDVAERVPAADVPATLARLLDEVEAARKGGA